DLGNRWRQSHWSVQLLVVELVEANGLFDRGIALALKRETVNAGGDIRELHHSRTFDNASAGRRQSFRRALEQPFDRVGHGPPLERAGNPLGPDGGVSRPACGGD